jgi:imidazolonepropionase-like amidohydrolase
MARGILAPMLDNHRALAGLAAVALTAAVTAAVVRGQPADGRRVVVFDGARVIVGDGSPPIEAARIVVRNGVIDAVGPRHTVAVPPGGVQIDLAGRTVMPTLVNVHGHIGYIKNGTTDKANYSRDNVLDDLRRLAYYGVGVFQALGTDRDGIEMRIRDEQRSGALSDPALATLFTSGPGIVAPTPDAANGGPYFATDVVFEAATPDAARSYVRQLAPKKPDIVKIWVDDRSGTKRKLTPDVSAAAIDEAHRQRLRAVAHVYYLDDAKALARAGVDGFAHLVRAEPGADAELVDLVRTRNIFQCSTLSIQRSAVDGPQWLDDPALAETIPPSVLAAWKGQVAKTSDAAATRARSDYARLERSLLAMHNGGARLVLCGDTGLGTQAPGFTEHRELEAIARAGVPALQAIRAATEAGAAVLGLTDRGSITAGKRADFLILSANPVDDIANTRKIVDVYRGGVRIDRAALRASWQSETR